MTCPFLLLTRPGPQSLRFAGMVSGARVVISPVLRIVGLEFDRAQADRAARLVFTSENAVAFAGAGWGRPALCVGPRTAQAAQAAGFAAVEGPGDAQRMLPMLGDWADALHLHGLHRAMELPLAGIAVYDQQAQPLTPEAREALAGDAPVILPLFSPRSARLLAAELGAIPARAPLAVVAISDNAGAAWRDAGGRGRIDIADAPDGAAMQRSVQRLIDRKQS